MAHQAADDAMLAILGKLRSFRGESRFTTWAYRFVVLKVSGKLGRHYWRRHPAERLDPEEWDRLAAVTAHRLAEAGHPAAQAWGCAVKAHAADVAYQAASELALLAGAAGFTADSRTAKTRGDLNALLYADGIHDSLYRAVGRDITGSARATVPEPTGPLVPAMREGRGEELVSA